MNNDKRGDRVKFGLGPNSDLMFPWPTPALTLRNSFDAIEWASNFLCS